MVRVSHVAANEVDAGSLQLKKKIGVSSKAVQFRDNEGCPEQPARFDGSGQFRASS
jgi:hypothetical protein